jgi:hypothetical protein
VLPGVMTDAKELLTQGGELLTKLCDVGNNDDIGAVLCWTTQEIAVAALLQSAVGGSPSDEAQQSLARIIAFETSLRKQSTLVLGIAGIALPPVVADGDGCDGDESGSSADEGPAVDPFVEQLLGRLEKSCPFAFSPLLHYFRAVLDPGTDPTGERSDALRERVAGRLQEIGPHSVEAMFLRKELQVGKDEMELPFWTGEIPFMASGGPSDAEKQEAAARFRDVIPEADVSEALGLLEQRSAGAGGGEERTIRVRDGRKYTVGEVATFKQRQKTLTGRIVSNTPNLLVTAPDAATTVLANPVLNDGIESATTGVPPLGSI